MRAVLFLTVIMTQLFLANVSFAQAYDDCWLSCAAAKDTRDMDCPSPYDSPRALQSREQCLKDSREIYISCIKSCPPPTSPGSPSAHKAPSLPLHATGS